MGKLKNPLFSLGARNSLAKVISFARRRKQNIVESKPIPHDAKSLAQLSWRHMYQKAVALWHALSATEKQEWESLARPKHMTGFAWFMSQALKPNPGLYLPLQGGTMAGNIDMAKHSILKLPLPTDAQEAATKTYVDTLIAASLYTQGARVYHNADQSIPHNTLTALAFNRQRYDTDSIHSGVTDNSRLTCKTQGKYLITATIDWEANAAGFRAVYIRLHGTLFIARHRHEAIGSQQTISTIYDLPLNDYAEVLVYQTSGGALNVRSMGNHSPEFMMQRIG